ncbi:PucR family transcriptional regulator ligand-binding domain-containing protein [Mycobacterium sp. ITM-2016-00317]|uniref:PucR family transcriptional regulator n=1 Tax=Mycobacterium sp. ITM-2016-00317 TaxID=2099694 RepID=UPI00287F4AE1|nr:PucR family transcriptional regulator ligand-binding domain-containing protein [Mycobacterium sp. ITM-2016-00317]WNG89785.1 PucR family transcriptional regulator ligand-binding domain-containing protein [Mycobacterium sp. ITM-2016-00317]
MTVQSADPAAAPHDGTVSLRQLLAEPDLHVDTLTPACDLDRPIRYVYPTELADPSPYLAGEELILSVGVPVAGQPAEAIQHYVGTLTDRGVAALLIGLGDVLDEIPAVLVDACSERDLPLLIQHAAVPFRRIIDWAESRRARDRETDVRERELGALLRWFVAGTLGVGPVESELARYGLSGAPVVVCAFTTDVHARVHELVDRHSGAVASLDDNIVALCPQTAEFSADLAASPLACGVALAADAQSMAYAIPEALEALHEASRWRRTVHIDEIATLQGLLAAVPKVRLVPFVHRLLVPLVDHDKDNSSYLVASLKAFLAPGNDISTAAGQLYVHVNTLRNRLAKIAELTGASPLDESDRINFRIALWAARSMGMTETAAPDTEAGTVSAKSQSPNTFAGQARGRRLPPPGS